MKNFLIAFLVFILSFFFLDLYVLSAVGLGLTAFIFFYFLDTLHLRLPIVELILLIAALQWIVGPIVEYRSDLQHFKYFMYVEETVYMGVVLLAFIAFSSILFVKQARFSYQEYLEPLKTFLNQHPQFPYALIAIGFISFYTRFYFPPALQFIIFLASQLRFIGALFLLFKENNNKMELTVVVGVLLHQVVHSIQAGMFHELILWGVFFFSFFVYRYRIGKLQSLAIILGGFFCLTLIQLVKEDYRAIIQAGAAGGGRVDLFVDMVFNKAFSEAEKEESNEELEKTNVRYNQGWIISAIIYNVPEREPYAEGETIYDALSASFLPRFLAPDKKKAGGVENFERFTGLKLAPGTSMGTSVIGEAYANFGSFGAAVFMLIWGFVLVLFYNKIVAVSQQHPTLILFLPLIFLQVVKAETELVVVLNHMVKASIFVFGVYWISRKVFKVEL